MIPIPKYDIEIVLGDCEPNVGREERFQPMTGQHRKPTTMSENYALLHIKYQL